MPKSGELSFRDRCRGCSCKRDRSPRGLGRRRNWKQHRRARVVSRGDGRGLAKRFEHRNGCCDRKEHGEIVSLELQQNVCRYSEKRDSVHGTKVGERFLSKKRFLVIAVEYDALSNDRESVVRRKYVIGPNGRRLTVADLPPPNTRRWVVRRKAEVVAAVRGGLLSLEEACSRYALNVEEFRSWQRDIDSFGVKGLRATRTQFYRSYGKAAHRP
jgi:Protein of unknown function (DUF1153)